MSRTCPQCNTEWTDDADTCPDDGAVLIDPLLGKSLGSYKVLKQIGKGGMGSVYLAEHPVIHSRVAIKVLHEKYAQDTGITDRFYNEARAVNLIGHDNVLKILDLNTTASGQPYFVMEFLDGTSLQERVDKGAALTLAEQGPIILQICAALQAAHDKKIIHRDLKPENIYLVTVGERVNFVKVVDFGIARLTDSQGQSAGQTRTGMVMGTPMYMSPEQGSGMTKNIDARSDIYSLGIIMYQLAAGKLPFAGKSFGELLTAHLQKPPPPPRSINGRVPADFERIILKALEKKQEDRYQSMHALAGAMREMLRANKVAFESPTSISQARPPPAPRPFSIQDTMPDTGMAAGQGYEPSVPTMVSEGASEMETMAPDTVSPTMELDRPRMRRAATDPPRIPTAPPKIPTNPPAMPGTSGRMRPSPRPAQSDPPAAKPSNRKWLYLGGGVAVVIATGLVLAMPSSDDTPSASARNASRNRTRAQAKQAAAAAAAEEKAAVPAPVAVSIATHPSPAHVTATWPDGSEAGESPLTIRAAPGTHVNVSIELDGYAPHIEELVVDETDQTVQVALHHAERRPARPKPAAAEARKSNDLVDPFSGK